MKNKTALADFTCLLSTGKKQEAIDFCEKMTTLYPKMSFYKFYLERLKNEVTEKVPDLSSQGESSLIESYKFNDSYSISEEVAYCESEAETLEYKRNLIKKLPFSGDIYLPTDKIGLAHQVSGLQKVLDLVSVENKNVTRNRFEELKRFIRDKGKDRIFIIGNGPSLKKTDLSFLKDEITIGFNGVFLHESFVPTIYIVEDHLVAEDRVKEIIEYDCPFKLFPSYLGYCIPVMSNSIFLNHIPRISFPVDTDFSDRAGEVTYTGGTVTYTGIQVAASLGVSEVFLVGVDASYSVDVSKNSRSNAYGTGVLESKGADDNHFDSRYFGAGYRWHDPNVNTMLQAYRKARKYYSLNNKKIFNATIGGELEVFPRVNYYDLFDQKEAYPRLAIVDFTDLNWPCATGIVKKNLLREWPANSLVSLFSRNPSYISAYHNKFNDLYASDFDGAGVVPALRSLIEYDPDVLYLRPTHDRPLLSLLQLLLPMIFQKPFVIHYMDDWLARLQDDGMHELFACYKKILSLLFSGSNYTLSISDKMSNFLESEFKIDRSRIFTIHNYCQNVVFQPKKEKETKGEKIVRYFGGLEKNMSLETVLTVARVVQIISQQGGNIKFEVYASSRHIELYRSQFADFDCTYLLPQFDDYLTYLSALASSSLNLLCYNFDGISKNYLQYSMANKLPEIISCNVPFLAIGNVEIGTLSYLNEINYPFLVLDNDEKLIQQKINELLGFETQKVIVDAHISDLLRMEFSIEKNLHGFERLVRQSNREGLVETTATYQNEIIQAAKNLLLLSGDIVDKTPSIKLLFALLSLSDIEKKYVFDEVANHGVTWSFKSKVKMIQNIIEKDSVSNVEKCELLVMAIVILETSRYPEIVKGIYKHFSGL